MLHGTSQVTSATGPSCASRFRILLSAVHGERPALPDAETSANWTMVGLCAHDSAMRGGDRVTIPTL